MKNLHKRPKAKIILHIAYYYPNYYYIITFNVYFCWLILPSTFHLLQHYKGKPVGWACVVGVFASRCVQMSVSDVICHADRQPAVCLITVGQPNAWPSSGWGPGGGSGGSIIHLHPCLCVMVPPCDRWPVYLWSPAATKADAHTHSLIQPAGFHKGLETHSAPQETPRSLALTHGSTIQAWLDVWYINHLVQIPCSFAAELPKCLIPLCILWKGYRKQQSGDYERNPWFIKSSHWNSQPHASFYSEVVPVKRYKCVHWISFDCYQVAEKHLKCKKGGKNSDYIINNTERGPSVPHPL